LVFRIAILCVRQVKLSISYASSSYLRIKGLFFRAEASEMLALRPRRDPARLTLNTLGLASLFPAAALARRRIEPLVVGLLLLLAV